MESPDRYFKNLDEYPKWQAYLRQHQPPTLIVRGRNDKVFLPMATQYFEYSDSTLVSASTFGSAHQVAHSVMNTPLS